MSKEILGMGWLPDLPDFRDYTDQTEEVRCILQRIGIEDVSNIGNLPESIDLRSWCSPIEHQGNLGSCTAQAGVGLVEFFQKRAFGKHLDGSALFLYKVTRNLMGLSGDIGASLRDTMKAMAVFGVPPEHSWPYVTCEDFDKEPSAFCYAFAQNYQAIAYYRLDPFGTSPDVLLRRIKGLLSKGLPSMFGFSVYASMKLVDDGNIPFPSDSERQVGGHAVVAVGYDDKRKIKNPIDNAITTGAFLIRNSWGECWGDDGYGWLPYKYVLQEQAIDWWTLLKNEWINTDEFN